MPKGVEHIRHRRNIPVANVAIGCIGFRLVIKPEVDGTLEVGVVQCHKFLSSHTASLNWKRKTGGFALVACSEGRCVRNILFKSVTAETFQSSIFLLKAKAL